MKQIYVTARVVLLMAVSVSCKTEVTDVQLNKSELTLSIGEAETLIAIVLPEKASNKAVSWKSDAPAVATVDNNGKITANAEGTAQITVTTKDGNKTASCTVTVPCNCIMDTLKGEWSWYRMTGGWIVPQENQFKSILKVVSQNKDGSINYEVVVADTLSYTGSFQIRHDIGRRTSDLKLPIFWNEYNNQFYFDYEWRITLRGSDVLWFWRDDITDANTYYYQKIK